MYFSFATNILIQLLLQPTYIHYTTGCHLVCIYVDLVTSSPLWHCIIYESIQKIRKRTIGLWLGCNWHTKAYFGLLCAENDNRNSRVYVTVSLCKKGGGAVYRHLLVSKTLNFQLNSAWLSSTQLDSAQLNLTQLDSAQLSSTQLNYRLLPSPHKMLHTSMAYKISFSNSLTFYC